VKRFPRPFRDLRESAAEQASAAVRLSVYFFLITAAASIIKVTKTSLFLGGDKSKLPFAYLISAVVMGFVVVFNTRTLQRLPARAAVQGSLGFFFAGLLLLRLLLPGHPRSGPLMILFWLWGEIFLVMSVAQFWILVNDLFPPRRTKALVGSFVKAGLLGGIAGSLAASRLAGPLGTVNLLPLTAAGLALAAVFIDPVLRRPGGAAGGPAGPGVEKPAAREPEGYGRSFLAVAKNRYLLLLSGTMFAAMTVTTLIDVRFNTILGTAKTVEAERTAFLGAFSTILFVVSYLLQAGLTHRVLRRFGLRTALMVTPVTLALGTAAVVFIPAAGTLWALWWGAALRGADKSLTHTFSQSTREILYVPVAPRLRAQAKIVIDMFVNKLGDAAASILLIVATAIFHPGWKGFSLLTAVFILGWLAMNLELMRAYGGVIRDNLQASWPDADKQVLEHIDVDAAKLVFDTLESRNQSSALYAMNLMDLVHRDRLSPDLKELLNAETSRVRAGALDALLDAGGGPLFPAWDEAVEDGDLDAQVREILALDVYRDVMKSRFEAWAERPEAGGNVSQMEAAKALGRVPAGSPLTANLRPLLRSPSAEVVLYALESAAKLGRREFVPLILPHLKTAPLASAAAAALQAYGERISGTLADAIADPEEDPAVRTALPDVLARAGTPRAASALLRVLRRRDEAVRTEVIQALVRIRADHPEIHLSADVVSVEIRRSIERACDMIERLDRNGEGGSPSAFAAVLGRVSKQVFDLLSLVYPHADIVRAWQNYARGERRAVDYSLDLLEHLLRREDKEAVLPFLEEAPAEERTRRCREIRRRTNALGS
jgi:ATP:ADP antiporter, AAA family